MKIKSIYTIDDGIFAVGSSHGTYEIGEISTTLLVAVKEDWFGVYDTEGNLRVLINPKNVSFLELE